MQPLAAMTWEEARDAGGRGAAAILPVGAVEAHGPHLPLETDVIIAEAMARAGAGRLVAGGVRVVVLPPLVYTAAAFAQGFAGTVSLRPETVTATVIDIAGSLARHGFGVLAIANAHLDPAHLASLDAAVEDILRQGALAPWPFPNSPPSPGPSSWETSSGAAPATRANSRPRSCWPSAPSWCAMLSGGGAAGQPHIALSRHS